MHKRLLTILAIITLSTALLIGCGNKQEEIPQATTEESTPTQTVEETTTPEETEEPTPEATEEPSEETTAETEPETTEPTETAEPEQTETPTTEPTEEPTPEAEPQATYTYTDMSATMYATQTVNVRDLPSTDGGKIGSLSTNQEITVLGQCNETSWYMFDYNGQTAFVSNKYISTEKVEVQQAPPAQETAQAPSNVPNPYELPTQTWIDMGDWFLYTQPSHDCPEGNTKSPFWQDKVAILQERYPNKQIVSGGGIWLDNGAWSTWCVSTYDGISADGTHGLGYPQSYMDFLANYQE